jgi:hypothetical protein
MAILSEAFSHEPFEARIKSTHAFVREILLYASDHAAEIKSINKQAEERTIAQGNIKKGVRYTMVPSEVIHKMPTYNYALDMESKKFRPQPTKSFLDSVIYYGGFKAEVESTMPSGYIIPKELTDVVENLRKHGIRVEALKRTKTFSGDVFQVERFETAQRKFEGHQVARATGRFTKTDKRFRKGDLMVDLAQPLGNLAFYLLEPESDDGLVTWNFFDGSIEKEKKDNNPIEYPVFRYYISK